MTEKMAKHRIRLFRASHEINSPLPQVRHKKVLKLLKNMRIWKYSKNYTRYAQLLQYLNASNTQPIELLWMMSGNIN